MTGITAIGIVSDTTMTIDIIAGDITVRAASTVTDAFVRGASPYRTASANHTVGIKGAGGSFHSIALLMLKSWANWSGSAPDSICSSVKSAQMSCEA